MKLKFIRENDLFLLRGNILDNIEYYKSDNPQWVKSLVGISEKPFVSFGRDIDCVLDMSKEKPYNTDIVNIKFFYLALRFLTDSQATDERLWVGLTHSNFWNYMQYRWPLSDKKSRRHIEINYFFGHATIRSLLTNGLARLWWFGRLTYTPKENNPFFILDYLSNDLNGKAYVLFATNFSSNKDFLCKFIKVLIEYEEVRNTKVDRNKFQKLVQLFNKFGGYTLVDTFSKQRVKEIIYNYLDNKEEY